MILNIKEFGCGYPVVVIHGLYGCSDNWFTFARRLSASFRVIAVDLRNHGSSPHSDDHTYELMANDVHELFERMEISVAHVIGHSMGGRVAMLFNSLFPDCVNRLVVVDISANVVDFNNVAYRMVLAEHRRIVKSLMDLPLQSLKSRKQADSILTRRIPHAQLRQFLLKNLKWNKISGFSWGFNLPVIAQNLERVLQGVHIETSSTQVLLVKGANSPYLLNEQIPEMLHIYPKMQVRVIENAGHWVHSEQPDEFFEAVISFLSNN